MKSSSKMKMKLPRRIPTTYLGDKPFDDSYSVPYVISSSTTEDYKEEEGDITDFELGDYPVIDTANRDQAAIEPSDKILPDSALDNTVCNHSCERIIEVGSSSYVINNPPLINDNINEAGSSKVSITTNSYFTSESNAIYLVLGGSSEFKNYDMEKGLFK